MTFYSPYTEDGTTFLNHSSAIFVGKSAGTDRLSIAILEDIIASNFVVEHVMKRDRNKTLQWHKEMSRDFSASAAESA